MESLLSAFLLFLAALTALLTYMFVPKMSITALYIGAVVALAIGIWWHWTQFSIDYRMSTWQETLRNYASYVIVLVVILLSYGFYVFSWNGGTLQGLAQSATASVREAGRKATARLASSVGRAASAANETLFAEVTPMNGERAQPPPVAE